MSSPRLDHVEVWLVDIQGRLAAATVARHYRNLQQLWRWLLDDGEIDARRWDGCARRRCPSSQCR
jgi:hypothetical protein